VPIRPKGHDWSRPVPGDTRQTEWQGFHPLDDLVQIVNPTTGYMQNCNVAPDAMAHVPLVRAGDYLPELFHARPGDTHSRGLRANQLLSQHDNLGREEAFRLVADTELPAIPRWKEYLRQAQPDLAGDDDARRFCELLADWNGRVDKDQPGATAFEHLIYELIELGGWGRIGPEVINRVERLEEEQRARLVKAIRRASARLLKNFGTLRVPWGDIHRIERNGSWPVDGAGIRFYATLRPAGYGPPDAQHKRAANSGQSHAMLVFLKPGAVESFSVTPFGISDRPESPHYNDQTRELFSPNRLKPTWFNERDLAQHVERTYELSYQP
jgi:acyl-homoserine lactone acylase PvdQ